MSSERSRGAAQVFAAVLWDGIVLVEWTQETLENRVFLLRDLLQRCEEEGYDVVDDLPKEEDPLWDPIEGERLIGVSQVLLESVLLQVEQQLELKILNKDGHQAGTLCLSVSPLSKDGTPGIPDSEVVDDPEEFIGTRMPIEVQVLRATGLPEELANDVRVEYDYFIDGKPHQVPAVRGHCRDPVFNYKHMFVQDPVTSRFLEYLQTTMMFRVYGCNLAARDISESGQSEHPASEHPASPLTELPPEPAALEIVQPPVSPGPGLPGAIGEEHVKEKVPSLSQLRRQQEEAAEEMEIDSLSEKKKKSKTCAIQ